MASDRPASDPAREARSYSETDPARPARKPPLGNLRPRARFSLTYYLLTLAGLLLPQLLFFSGVDAPEIPYSEFRAAVDEGRVAQVVLTQERIYGQLRPSGPEPAAPPAPGLEVPAPKAPWHVGRIAESWQRLRGDLEQQQ